MEDGGNASEEAAAFSSKIGNMIKVKCKELGPLTFKEGVVLAHFMILVLLWFVRSPGFFHSDGDLEGRPEIGRFKLNQNWRVFYFEFILKPGNILG